MTKTSTYGNFITKPEYPNHYFITEEEVQLRARLWNQFCRSWGKRAEMATLEAKEKWGK